MTGKDILAGTKKLIKSNLSTKQTTKTNTHGYLAIIAVKIRAHHIYTKKFEYVLKPCKYLYIVVIFIYIESIAACNKVPVKSFKERNFIGKQSIEMVLYVTGCIKRSRCTI